MTNLNPIVAEDLREILDSGINFSRFYNKTVLITGGNGFLPAYMIETLLALNEKEKEAHVRVIALVRSAERAKIRFKNYLHRSDLIILEQDVSDFRELSEPVHFIVHAASQASPKYYGTDPVGTLTPNVIGTMKLLEFSRKQKLEGFLFFSSGEVYGNLPKEMIPTNETSYGYLDPMNVRSCYGESKRMGETMCVAWAHQHGVPVRVARPFHTYGPGMLLDDGRVFSDFVANILQGKDIELKSDGSAVRAFCYLADATRGFFTVLLEGEIGAAYNIGNEDEKYSVLELAELLTQLFPEKNLKVIRLAKEVSGSGYLKSPISVNCPDISKVVRLGWKPKYNAATGFRRTIRSFI